MHETFPFLWGRIIETVKFGKTPDRMALELSGGFILQTESWTMDPRDCCYSYFMKAKRIVYNIHVGGDITEDAIDHD